MRCTLIGVAGPLAGTILAMEDGLTLRDACLIREADSGAYSVRALSRTAIFVNGLPVTERVLQARDELRVGDSLFIVHEDTGGVAPRDEVVAIAATHEEGIGAHVVLELSTEDAFQAGAVEEVGREARDLAALMRVGTTLSAIEGLAALDPPLAALLIEALPARRIAFVGRHGDPSHVSGWSARNPNASRMRIDASLVRRVTQLAVTVVAECHDEGDVPRSILVAPVNAFGRPSGAIWAEAWPDTRFDRTHARLFLAIAGFIGVARAHAGEADRLHAERDIAIGEVNLDHNIVGTSRPMQQVLERIARVSASDATILVLGESGTGKELVARAVHRNSRRAERPFVAINCAALTETLLESELFGHEKGAFTGAIGQKKGRLELADGGTVFLDEIGEMPLTLQVKLLRAIQEREFERVGGTRPVRVDFRLIAATNRDLDAAVKAGAFRQDLFYRLNVVSVPLPPLRERGEDVELLAEYFVRKHAPRCGRRVIGLAADAIAALRQHTWPGNVRELENVIEQALVLGSRDRIVAADLPEVLTRPRARTGGAESYHDAVEETKRELIVKAFEQAGGNHTAAARLLGVHPNYLHRLVKNLDLKPIVKGRL